jgi:putative ABC transport system substrate-binding protein
MRRWEFIAGLASAAAWPAVARGQQAERMRRIGVLAPTADSDLEVKERVSGFTQALADLGWTDGRNLRMDVRGGAVDRVRVLAKEIVDLRPDVRPNFA